MLNIIINTLIIFLLSEEITLVMLLLKYFKVTALYNKIRNISGIFKHIRQSQGHRCEACIAAEENHSLQFL